MNKPIPDPLNPGQESVWDYPRPAVAEPFNGRLRVVFGGKVIADTLNGVRTLETSHPPTYYIPPSDIDPSCLAPRPHRTLCEWKGQAVYFDVVVDRQRAENAAWAYTNPATSFAIIKDHVAFYCAAMEACFVDDEQAQAQPGQFYGGWVTSHVAGPFKGIPGSMGW
ncbi:MAG: DUF427 domain-containing protein [Pseudomonadota bacterium]